MTLSGRLFLVLACISLAVVGIPTDATAAITAVGTNLTIGGDRSSYDQQISADGSTVVFASQATNLIPGAIDPNNIQDVFVWNGTDGLTNLTAGADSSSGFAQVSANGSTVVFNSGATNLIPGVTDPNTLQDVFVWTAANGLTNITAGGDNHSSELPGVVSRRGNQKVSADGSTVVFMSGASNLIPGVTDPNNSYDVFVWTAANGLTNVTVGGDSHSAAPQVSADGSTIVFESHAANLVPGVTDPTTRTDIFVWTEADGITNLTPGGDNDSSTPQISADGSTVVFHSQATNLIPGVTDPNSIHDVFVWTAADGLTNLTAGGDIGSGGPRVSADGSTVVFNSWATNLIPDVTEPDANSDVFVWTALDGLTNLTLSGDSDSFAPRVSADGSTVVFNSDATNLIGGVTEPDTDIDAFVWTALDGLTNLTAGGDNNTVRPQISADGSTIALTSGASDLNNTIRNVVRYVLESDSVPPAVTFPDPNVYVDQSSPVIVSGTITDDVTPSSGLILQAVIIDIGRAGATSFSSDSYRYYNPATGMFANGLKTAPEFYGIPISPDGTWSIRYDPQLANGSVSIGLRAFDAAGNKWPAAKPWQAVVILHDSSKPTAVIDNPPARDIDFVFFGGSVTDLQSGIRHGKIIVAWQRNGQPTLYWNGTDYVIYNEANPDIDILRQKTELVDALTPRLVLTSRWRFQVPNPGNEGFLIAVLQPQNGSYQLGDAVVASLDLRPPS